MEADRKMEERKINTDLKEKRERKQYPVNIHQGSLFQCLVHLSSDLIDSTTLVTYRCVSHSVQNGAVE